MTETIVLLLMIGAGCLVYQGVYHSGKVAGSRKGYNVGRKHARRRR